MRADTLYRPSDFSALRLPMVYVAGSLPPFISSRLSSGLFVARLEPRSDPFKTFAPGVRRGADRPSASLSTVINQDGRACHHPRPTSWQVRPIIGSLVLDGSSVSDAWRTLAGSASRSDI